MHDSRNCKKLYKMTSYLKKHLSHNELLTKLEFISNGLNSRNKMNSDKPLDINQHASELLENKQQMNKNDLMKAWLQLFNKMNDKINIKTENEDVQEVIELINSIMSMSDSTRYIDQVLQNSVMEKHWEEMARVMVIVSCDRLSYSESRNFQRKVESMTDKCRMMIANMDEFFEYAADMRRHFNTLQEPSQDV